MNRLCDEILQLILNELDNPTNFSLTSKPIYAFTRVPYVRATYFLSRYGNTHALYYALGRGKLMSKEVIDILLSSGAHFSRYLVQCIIQHYFRSHVPFIKTHWVRTLDFSLVNHLLSIAADRFGDVPVGKGEDDGSSLSALLIESRLPLEHRSVTWEAAKDIVEKYKFMPLCSKDPMMLKFPLVLAVEPRLLPYARANGFIMDTKYRNFIFRKIFEKSSGVSDSRTHDIVDNVRELSKLDPHMYLTRTVAAEICMECVSNEAGYSALKTLDKEGILKFDLSTVVRDLIKTFATTRSITLPHTPPIIRKLFKDFPSQDLTVRMVLLIQVFREKMYATPEQMSHTARTFWESYVRNCRTRIDELGLGPVKASDLRAVLINRFAPESYLTGILDYARVVMNLSRMEIDNLVQDIALACLEIGCKGRMLEKLVEKYPFLKDVIRKKVMKEYRMEMDVDGLPDWSVDERKCAMFEARLCRDFILPRIFHSSEFLVGSSFDGGDILAAAALAMGAGMGGGGGEDVAMAGVEEHDHDEERMDDDDDDDVNYIGQDTLSAMIRRDETHGRRRFYDSHSTHIESSGRLSYPTDYQPLGKAIRGIFGLRSGVTAVFLMHAVANGNPMAIQPYCGFLEEPSPSTQIPVTLKLFKILARLGRAPPSSLIEDIESGAEFFFSEEDYLSADELNGIGPKTKKRKYSRIRVRLVSEYSVKKESVSPAPPSCLPSTSTLAASSGAGSSASARSAVVDVKPPADTSTTDTESSPKGKKRPRRSAVVAPKSYYVPDSDDEGIMSDEEDVGAGAKLKSNSLKKVRKAIREESNLQKWIKHLGVLFKEEQKKYNEKKRKAQQAAPPGVKLRFARNDFLRTLSYQLQCLRKRDKEKRQALYGPDVPSEDYSSGEEDEYHERTTRSSKRRRTIA